MMLLYLECRGRGMALDLPATCNDAARAIRDLTAGFEDELVPIVISGVGGPVPNLYPYIQHTNLTSEADIQRLNRLAERIDRMSAEERGIFSGALGLEGTGGLEDVLHIADNLHQYMVFPQITTDEELGRFLVTTAPITGKFLFPEEVHPYLDYSKIGAAQRDTLGGVYSPYGLVKRREEAPVQEEGPKTIVLTLIALERSDTLALPASAERLAQAKRALEIEDFSQAVIVCVECEPQLIRQIPMDGITVEGANEMALCLQQIKMDGETVKYCAILEAEQPGTFAEALSIAKDRDDYEQVPEDMDAYGRQVLRRAGAGEEVIDTIDGYMDFAQLGRDSMAEDGVRRTELGLVRRLSRPFPKPEAGQAMM